MPTGFSLSRHVPQTAAGTDRFRLVPAVVLIDAVGHRRADRIVPADDDTYFGTLLADSINGQDGNDTLRGAEGNDDITAMTATTRSPATPATTCWWARAATRSRAAPGNDELEGGRGSDILRGDDGDDTLNGSFDADPLSAGPATTRSTPSTARPMS